MEPGDDAYCDQLEATRRKGHTRLCLLRLQNLIPWQGCMNGVLCWAAKDSTSGPRVCPSQMCDHGKAHSLSGLRCIVCEKKGQVLTVCEIPSNLNTLNFQTMLAGAFKLSRDFQTVFQAVTVAPRHQSADIWCKCHSYTVFKLFLNSVKDRIQVTYLNFKDITN